MKKRYRTVNDYYREIFGEKIFKLPIDAGFDCPNRDGTVAHGGCTFCTVSGSGDAIVAPEAPIREQFYHEIDFMHRKWPEVHKYLVYFQNFTNTHAPLEVIKDRYEQAINEPGVVGINIGTRPDCLPDDVIDYLAELTDRMHVTVELGLQTTYEETSELINRAHSYELYVETVKRLRERAPKAEIVSHLINGLPGETHEMMVENVRRCVTDNDIQGIKLHLLHLMTNTRMQRDYHEGDESIVVDATMGNGNDTAFLAGLSKKVYAFDVQEQAIGKTSQRLSDLGIENTELILDGHENLDHYVREPIRAAIFNLGYLPSADKSVITKPHTTLEAIEKILDRLEVGGRLAIMIYYGHDGGDMEKDAVLEYDVAINF